MFDILRNLDASSEDLTAAYIKAIALEKQLSSERKEIHQKLLQLQVDFFSAKPSKELLSVKTEMDALIIRLEACRFGQQQLKTRLGEVLLKDATLRLQKITKELDAVASEEKKLQEAFLDSAARTAVIRESIRGQALSHDTRGNYQTSIPNLEVKLHLIDLKDGKIYSDRVEHYRREMQVGSFGGTIRGRQDDLTQERNRLERLLSGDPAEEAQRLLDKVLPPTPEPEKPEARKTQTFIQDYDRIGPVDYGTGRELPYRSVGEIITERANS